MEMLEATSTVHPQKSNQTERFLRSGKKWGVILLDPKLYLKVLSIGIHGKNLGAPNSRALLVKIYRHCNCKFASHHWCNLFQISLIHTGVI
jgi:hypothetical protein